MKINKLKNLIVIFCVVTGFLAEIHGADDRGDRSDMPDIFNMFFPSEQKVNDFIKKERFLSFFPIPTSSISIGKASSVFPAQEIIPLYQSKKDVEIETCFGLSIDGGGMRGLMPAIWLQELHNSLKDEVGEKDNLSKVFDYIGGTSIGGILSLGVACGIEPNHLLDLFKNKGDQIFPRKGRGWGWFGPKYNCSSLEKLLQEEFKDKTLKDLETNVLVTACTTSGKPHIFKKGKEQNYKLWEVARCTSAAPTYFDAYQPSLDHETQLSFVDGGLWVNNPSTLVTASIIEECQGGIFNPEKIYMLSLGTGEYPMQPIPDKAGKIAAGRFIDCLMNSHSAGNHMMMDQLLGDHYYRVNVSMDKFIDLDDIDQCEVLTQYAEKEKTKIYQFVNESREPIRKKLERGNYYQSPVKIKKNSLQNSREKTEAIRRAKSEEDLQLQVSTLKSQLEQMVPLQAQLSQLRSQIDQVKPHIQATNQRIAERNSRVASRGGGRGCHRGGHGHHGGGQYRVPWPLIPSPW